MPKKKKQARKKKKRTAQSVSTSTSSSLMTASDRFSDSPLFLATVIAGLVIGFGLGTGYQQPEYPAFFLGVAVLLGIGHWGSIFRRLRAAKPPKEISHSVKDLKKSLDRESREAHAEYRRLKWIFIVSGYILLAGVLLLFAVHSDPWITALLVFCSLLLFTLRALTPNSPDQVVIQSVLSMSLVTLLPPIGMWTQIGEFHLQTAVLGFIPGSLLAAAFVLEHANILESAGWRFSRRDTGRRGESRVLPLGITRLYSLFLLGGLALTVLLASFAFVPHVLMFSGVLFFFVPARARACLEEALPPKTLAFSTLKIALFSSSLMLVLGLLARA